MKQPVIVEIDGGPEESKIGIITVHQTTTVAEFLRLAARDAPRWATGQPEIVTEGIAVIGNIYYMLGRDKDSQMVGAYWKRYNKKEEDIF